MWISGLILPLASSSEISCLKAGAQRILTVLAEALNAHALAHHCKQHGGQIVLLRPGTGILILRHQPRNQDEPAIGHEGHDIGHHRAADIVEIDVHAVWQGCRQLRLEIGRIAVCHRVIADDIEQIALLVFAACNADDAATARFDECTDGGTNGTRRTAHQDRLAFLDAACDIEADIGGEAGKPANAERILDSAKAGGTRTTPCPVDTA